MPHIKAIIFDVDGTLYHSPEIVFVMKKYWTGRIAARFKISAKQAEEKYLQMKKQYGSTTEGLRRLGFGSLEEISYQIQNVVNRAEFIKKDKKLVAVINKLKSNYRLFLLRNGLAEGTFKVLKLLGFSVRHYNNIYHCSKFEKVFSVIEDFGVMKPDLKPFKGIIKYTKLKPKEHLMIGDRIDVDLIPAKKAGMKTALVAWGKELEKHRDVDYYLDTIYQTEIIIAK